MQNIGPAHSHFGLEPLGIQGTGTVFWNLTTPMLYEHAVKQREGEIAHLGPLVVRTGKHTGRSPRDKFIVREEGSGEKIWWGEANRPISREKFNALHNKVMGYLQGHDLYVFDGYAGADPRYRMRVRIVTEYAWHSLFARNMFIQEHNIDALRDFVPEFTVIDVPRFFANPHTDGTNSPTFILMDFSQKLVLIGGTEYAGEIKKSIFTALNYYLPLQGVLPMHCSANYGQDKHDAAVFFGLSGTGKTTLSSDPKRTLIGDDEHGWSDEGIFNFEGGCYAKVIRLSPEGEPLIFATTRMFGTILENVVYDRSNRRINLEDASLTENTRASYPATHIRGFDRSGMAGHPRHVIFLTADAFGVLPPLSRLTKAQAMYHFLSGYTAKVAGTERGVSKPIATFSACFGEPFMPLHPGAYAELLGQNIENHGSRVWLVNTGWTGGAYGTGSRIRLDHTRRMVHAILNDELADCAFTEEPFFGLAVPEGVPDVPEDILNPRDCWSNKRAYDAQAGRLVKMFQENFQRYEGGVSPEVVGAGPPAPSGSGS